MKNVLTFVSAHKQLLILSKRNQSIDFLWEQIDWFVYNGDISG